MSGDPGNGPHMARKTPKEGGAICVTRRSRLLGISSLAFTKRTDGHGRGFHLNKSQHNTRKADQQGFERRGEPRRDMLQSEKSQGLFATDGAHGPLFLCAGSLRDCRNSGTCRALAPPWSDRGCVEGGASARRRIWWWGVRDGRVCAPCRVGRGLDGRARLGSDGAEDPHPTRGSTSASRRAWLSRSREFVFR